MNAKPEKANQPTQAEIKAVSDALNKDSVTRLGPVVAFEAAQIAIKALRAFDLSKIKTHTTTVKARFEEHRNDVLNNVGICHTVFAFQKRVGGSDESLNDLITPIILGSMELMEAKLRDHERHFQGAISRLNNQVTLLRKDPHCTCTAGVYCDYCTKKNSVEEKKDYPQCYIDSVRKNMDLKQQIFKLETELEKKNSPEVPSSGIGLHHNYDPNMSEVAKEMLESLSAHNAKARERAEEQQESIYPHSDVEFLKNMQRKGNAIPVDQPADELTELGKMYAILRQFDRNTRHRMSVWIKDRFEGES